MGVVLGKHIPSGKHTKSIKKLLKMAIEIVDLPTNNMVVFQFVISDSLPRGYVIGWTSGKVCRKTLHISWENRWFPVKMFPRKPIQ